MTEGVRVEITVIDATGKELTSPLQGFRRAASRCGGEDAVEAPRRFR